ncbi:MAG: hypothetical protein M9908_09945 [Phyllobacteriaceae bacterium]|nr:hypothetical protein [Phyllobacteriaceae bacterium]
MTGRAIRKSRTLLECRFALKNTLLSRMFAHALEGVSGAGGSGTIRGAAETGGAAGCGRCCCTLSSGRAMAACRISGCCTVRGWPAGPAGWTG